MSAQGENPQAARFEIDQQTGQIVNVGRDSIVYADPNAAGLQAIREAGAAVKTLLTIGMFLCISAFGLFGYGLFSNANGDFNDPNFGKLPSQIPVAAGMFFAGFVLTAIASVAANIRRRG